MNKNTNITLSLIMSRLFCECGERLYAKVSGNNVVVKPCETCTRKAYEKAVELYHVPQNVIKGY